ncbi:succinyl-diaminopimelate desuccinylase [uncultured Flavonifractor sp.]|uniref:M20/M25/M40 family metallo-hydrolase n=1 Tax=Oscillospiraceae TaxID=216572 RepID=UPI000822653C|nr:M20/M25/M40 family metallo-hydrolase [Lawsonibacter sp. OA9]MCH1978621.1 M20/M25/M40 family metallo-hydrolase [Lawsonibacter sp. OA9]SCH79284.1 succinyl-diaminopimelate desuccinylase [uncultured Clostridium sp.]SCI85495.1 succinyl-diaminopimelate desuccinylase [uncultured Flavonifractor sp.]
MQNYPFYDEALALTKKLVSIPSMNNSDGGERAVADYMAAWIRELPYFKAHPDQVITQPLKNDPYDRINVVAIAFGSRSNSNETIILHGHHDTVGIDDYGSIKEYAFDCDALPEKIKSITSDPEVLADIESGEWMFGRGSSDMKSGDAVNMVLMRYFTEHLDQFDGNLIFMTNPVEENQHTGIIESLNVLEELKAKYGLTYKMAMNTDFISPAFPGDTAHYFHAGAVGKILPCFYIIGKPTHSGQGFEGFSASMVAAEITRNIDMRAEFSDVYNGEFAMPPTVLKMRDLKPSYDVQTAFSAFVYFNYFIHNMEMDEIFARLRKVAEDALNTVDTYTDEQNKVYCKMTGADYYKREYQLKVMEYSELYEKAKALKPDVDEDIRAITKQSLEENLDRRELCLKIVEYLANNILSINTPTVILFLAPPYCPRNTLKREIPEEGALLDSVVDLLNQLGQEMGEELKMMQFFPVLTDSSYLKLDDTDTSIKTLVDNFPDMKGHYDVPLDQIKRLNIPAFNFGCHGKDAHKWTERVHKEYSFGKLPIIMLRVLEKYLNEK